MSMKMYFRCYKCRCSVMSKQSLVKREGHLHCKPCARAIDAQALPDFVPVQELQTYSGINMITVEE